MIDTDKYEGHIENIGRWRNLANALPRWAEEADRELVQDAPLLLQEVKRLRRDRDLLWDAIRLSGTGCWREEEIAFWHEKLLNMNEAKLKETLKKHYGDE